MISGELSGTIPRQAPFQEGPSLDCSCFPHCCRVRRYDVSYLIESRGIDAIHPDGIDSLGLVIRTPAAALYAVPAEGARAGG